MMSGMGGEEGGVFLFLLSYARALGRTARDGRERLSRRHNDCRQRQLAGEALAGAPHGVPAACCPPLSVVVKCVVAQCRCDTPERPRVQ